MAFYKFMASDQQNLKGCLGIVINMHLWQFVCLNLSTFIASAVPEKWKHMIFNEIKLFNIKSLFKSFHPVLEKKPCDLTYLSHL